MSVCVMESNIMKEAKYENRIVIFIDILGFKRIVKNSVQDESRNIPIIKNALTYVKTKFGRQRKYFKSLQVTQFSDSIFISFTYGETGCALSLLQQICKTQRGLLMKGFLCRGGISYGKAIHTGKYMFGPAVNSAYMLESNVAVYPRIVIDVEAIKLLHEFPDEIFKRYEDVNSKYVDHCLLKDGDGFFYVDYLEIQREDKDFTHILLKTINEGLKNQDSKIVSKYMWLKEKYNDKLREIHLYKPSTDLGMTIDVSKLRVKWINALNFIE